MKTSYNSKNLRKNLTDAEKKLWYKLRDRRFCNYKFRRQVQIDKYIIDFVCLERKLIIELDGSQHNFSDNAEKDKIRDTFFKAQGFKILRFWNCDISSNFENVLETIYRELN